jgi:alanine-synthesizing transaminase
MLASCSKPRQYQRFLRINQAFRAKRSDHVDLLSGRTFTSIVASPLSEAAILEVVRTNGDSITHYPAAYMPASELSEAFVDFMRDRHGVALDAELEVAVSPGSTQAIGALSRVLPGRSVIVPELTVPWARVIPAANGADLVYVPLGPGGVFEMRDLRAALESASADGGVRYIYLNYPSNPSGVQPTHEAVRPVVSLAREMGVPILHDHDMYFSTHREDRPIFSILQIPEAREVAVEVYTFSKELALSGLRVAVVAGAPGLIRMLRVYNYEMAIMTPHLNQLLGAEALRAVQPEDVRLRVHAVVDSLVQGLRGLGWCDLSGPDAGVSFLFPVPPAFMSAYGDLGGEIFCYWLQEGAGVALAPASIFGPGASGQVRVLAVASVDECRLAVDRLNELGVGPAALPPPGVESRYRDWSR